ncbi:MAG: CDP-glucose 4,6-dehydratase [Bdellovibrionota bacterium]
MDNNLTNFWKNKKVVVTGGEGFKGSWLVLFLHELGAKVCSLGLPVDWQGSISEYFQDANIEIERHRIDIRDYEKTRESLVRIEPDIVFHLAAEPIVLNAQNNPLDCINTNVLGVANLFEACRGLLNLKAVVNVTSDKVYFNSNHVTSFSETSALGGKDIYSASKACSEIVTRSFYHSYFEFGEVGIATARGGNVIGGGDWSKHRIVPDIFRSLKSNEKLEIRSPGSFRPWQHVLDCVWGYVCLAKHIFEKKTFENYNFGPSLSKPQSVKDLYEELVSVFPELEKTGVNWGQSENTGIESKFLSVDSTRARVLLDWQSYLNFKETVAWTADWYRVEYESNSNAKEMIEITKNQVSKYLNYINQG